VLFAFVYLLLRCVVRLVAGSSMNRWRPRSSSWSLSHQLRVLKRQAGRPQLHRRDQVFMAAISRVLPRTRWSSFLVCSSASVDTR
jgi:putative transposase